MYEEVLLGKGAGQILLEQVSRTGQLSRGSWLSHSPVAHCLTTEFLPGPFCKLGLNKTSPITHHSKLQKDRSPPGRSAAHPLNIQGAEPSDGGTVPKVDNNRHSVWSLC